MRTIKIIVTLVLMSNALIAMDIFDEIANAIRSGDSQQLSTFFNTSIDLTILDKESIYSKAQAELILKDFFSKNPPKTFNIIHNGSSPEGTQYAIGNLVTTNGKTFRTTFYIKNSGGKSLLHELRIEAQ